MGCDVRTGNLPEVPGRPGSPTCQPLKDGSAGGKASFLLLKCKHTQQDLKLFAFISHLHHRESGALIYCEHRFKGRVEEKGAWGYLDFGKRGKGDRPVC